MKIFNIRPAVVADLPRVSEMIWELVLAEREVIPARYPQITSDTKKEVTTTFMRSFHNPLFHCEVSETDGELTGFITGSIVPNQAGEPKVAMRIDMIWVAPENRPGLSRTGLKLIRALCEWGTSVLSQYIPDKSKHIIEASYVPGGPSEKIWCAAGMKSYLSLCAWVAEDGTQDTEHMQRYLGG